MSLAESVLPVGTVIASPVRSPGGSTDSLPQITQVNYQDADVALEIQSTSKAFVPSRMTTVQINSLIATHGMIVYDTTLGHLVLYDNTDTWVPVGGNSGGVIVETVTVGPVQMLPNYRYIVNSAGAINLNLPQGAEIGDVIEIIGIGAGLWSVTQQSILLELLQIRSGLITTSLGDGGVMASTAQGDSVRIVYVDNNLWQVSPAPQGSLNLT